MHAFPNFYTWLALRVVLSNAWYTTESFPSSASLENAKAKHMQ